MDARPQPHDTVARHFDGFARLITSLVVSNRHAIPTIEPSTGKTVTPAFVADYPSTQDFLEEVLPNIGRLLLDRLDEVKDAAVEFSMIEHFATDDLVQEIARRNAPALTSNETSKPEGAIPEPSDVPTSCADHDDSPDPGAEVASALKECVDIVKCLRQETTKANDNRSRAYNHAFTHILHDISTMKEGDPLRLVVEASKSGVVISPVAGAKFTPAALRARMAVVLLTRKRRGPRQGKTWAQRNYHEACNLVAYRVLGGNRD